MPPGYSARRVAAFVTPYRRPLAATLASSLFATVALAVEPLVLKRLFDGLAAAPRFVEIGACLGVLVGLGLFRELLTAASNWLTWRTRLSLHHDLLESAVERLHVLPVAYHKDEGVGATMTRLDRGIQGLLEAFNQTAFSVLPAIVYLGVSVSIMLDLDVRLAVLVLLFAPIPALIATWSAPERIRRERRLLDRWSRIYARFNEVLTGIITVKSFAMEEREKHRFLDDVGDANRIVERGVGVDSAVAGAQSLVVLVARIGALGLGSYFVARGEMTVGTVVAFLSYVGGLFGPVQGLSSVYKTLRTARVSADVLLEILDAHDAVPDAVDAVDLPPLRGSVRFEGVRFQYESGRTILDGIDLEVSPGEKVALVGPSGAGKTTMMALLQRLYDPTSGRVVIDGLDLKTVRQRSLRKQIGVVLQDPVLFDDSLENNVKYGRPDATHAEVEAAVHAANATDIVRRLPRGYATRLGERGGRLSAGERQRIAIARALLKDPPVLILDEATSALDAESEHLVQCALDRLVEGRSTFIVAHRLSTVVSADRILVLRDGKIAEDGDHRTLMKLGGYYARLVERQLGSLHHAA
jgi:ATP-binding cassette, subfamily B, bacterial